MSEGLGRVRVSGLAPNEYLLSMREGGHDIIEEGIRIAGDTTIQAVIGTDGGSINGTIVRSADSRIANGIVALVPDEPGLARSYFYRSATADQNGEFAIRGIAPGAYRIFAWQELPGAAYRNAEFMKQYEGQGLAVKIKAGENVIPNHVVVR